MAASIPKHKKMRKEKGFESEKLFYLSLYKYNPNSAIAKRFFKDAKITKKEINEYLRSKRRV